jgi:hypothetical protein
MDGTCGQAERAGMVAGVVLKVFNLGRCFGVFGLPA